MEIVIRQTKDKDYAETEKLTREAFLDVYRPGCDEHFILHNLRRQDSFLPDLDLLAEADHVPVASIVYTRGRIVAADGTQHEAISFGPVSVRPHWQKKGIGSALIQYSLTKAAAAGFGAVFITGAPGYYSRFGFGPAARYQIFLPGKAGEQTDYFMVKLLQPDALEGIEGIYRFDPAFETDPDQLEEFDRKFQAMD